MLQHFYVKYVKNAKPYSTVQKFGVSKIFKEKLFYIYTFIINI